MATVHSTLAESVSVASELQALQAAYAAVCHLLGELAAGHVDRWYVLALLEPLTERFAIVCERIELEGVKHG